MSKKKAFSGHTMSLKDFHGGSIPTNLLLPSAPGVSNDWTGHDRPNSWGGRMSRPDHCVRPPSSPATRNWDYKTPFPSRNIRIGCNFDEEERKPLDGFSAPRRTFSDESFRAAPRKVELMPALSVQLAGSYMAASATESHARRVHERAHLEMHLQNVGDTVSLRVGGSSANAWTVRKQLVMGIDELLQPAWSETSAVSKLAHASALEKVSSGRWQTNHSMHNQTNAEVVEHVETVKDIGNRGSEGYAYNRMNVARGTEISDAMLSRHVERGLAIENRIPGHRKELAHPDRDRAPLHSELKERNPLTHIDRVQLPCSDARSGGSIGQPPVHPEASERPKVKLLPRTKPLEISELPVPHHIQENQLPGNLAHGYAITSEELHPNVDAAKPPSVCVETENQMFERQKLNLNPRSPPLEQLDRNIERERKLLFGGARPREVVLKERGIDDAAMINHDFVRHLDRTKLDAVKTLRVTEHATPRCNGQYTDTLPLGQRIVKKFERKDQQVDIETVDVQRRNWHNENRRNNTGRRQQKERQPSPETWRKHVEQPKPASPDAGLRYGKIASALELALAFSISFSDKKLADRCSGQRSLPGNMRMPFSRLMTPIPRRQINGY
ncbi:hypothetical protein SADUNF_Sadunf11G0017100 [Salix dunnii]|uniref:Uncharacterized protein n=1 Tax=Salix dunnii TaxID=1413687 RepID=A0A835JN41_9ROSI|nr:hypothetical protein SADUNF_Sadunf11G0017100 [Salix dunnii]